MDVRTSDVASGVSVFLLDTDLLDCERCPIWDCSFIVRSASHDTADGQQ